MARRNHVKRAGWQAISYTEEAVSKKNRNAIKKSEKRKLSKLLMHISYKGKKWNSVSLEKSSEYCLQHLTNPFAIISNILSATDQTIKV